MCCPQPPKRPWKCDWEKAATGHEERRISSLFLFLLSYVTYYQLLPGIFAASLGAIAGVTLNEFTQMLLSVIYSNFRLCLPGFCIWMQRSDKHFSFLYNLHLRGWELLRFLTERWGRQGKKMHPRVTAASLINSISRDCSGQGCCWHGLSARPRFKMLNQEASRATPIHFQEAEPPSGCSQGRE